jgi:uncharacterized protein YndB with AHSA1/START domain
MKINRWLALILGIVAGFLVLFLALAALQPAEVTLERSIVIARPPAEVHAFVDDYKNFPSWNPWQKLDPNMKLTYREKTVGVGAGYGWVGNNEAGTGSMETLASTPGQSISQAVHFVKPFESESTAHFTFTPEGAGTKVTWAFACPLPYPMMRFAGGMIKDGVGKDYDEGLANLKRVLEKPA